MNNLSYWDIYKADIMPKLQQIDLLLKSGDYIHPPTAASVLGITTCELNLLMQSMRISSITRKTFPLIMQNGSSKICKLFARQLRLGLTDNYVPAQLAYIYNINKADVETAFNHLGITCANTAALGDVFKAIPLTGVH